MSENDQEPCHDSLRTFAGQDGKVLRGGYGAVVREERFFCAVLFHLLLSEMSSADRMREVLQKCGVPDAEHRDLSSVRVFVEYAMARDIWNHFGKDESTGKVDKREANRLKHDFLRTFLPIDPSPDWTDQLPVEKKGIQAFNDRFIERKGPNSETDIESPARWSDKRINASARLFPDKGFQDKAQMLKWAFNVKPDIVIELDEESVVCIEAKVESSQDVYSNGLGFTQTQCQVQSFLMSELLGFTNVHQVFLAPWDNRKEPPYTHVTWASIFKGAKSTNQTVNNAIARVIAIEKDINDRRSKSSSAVSDSTCDELGTSENGLLGDGGLLQQSHRY